jgi:hypothetical protein
MTITTTEDLDMAKKSSGELVRFGAYLRTGQLEALHHILAARGVRVKGPKHGK